MWVKWSHVLILLSLGLTGQEFTCTNITKLGTASSPSDDETETPVGSTATAKTVQQPSVGSGDASEPVCCQAGKKVA